MSIDAGISTILDWVRLGLTVVGLIALIDASLRPAAAYVAAGKLTKPGWLAIVGLSTVFIFLFGPISFFGIPALVAVIVYFVDVRPALRGVTGGGGGSVGPYGPW